MSYTMDLIRTEHLELSSLELEKKKKTAIIDFVYSLASANIDTSAPNLAKIYMCDIAPTWSSY